MEKDESIFADALIIESAAERAAFLDEACGDDDQLRLRVERLLRAHEKQRGILESPPDAVATLQNPPQSENIGSTIGRYKLLEQIGIGGMGVVYVAEQLQPVRRKVALKIIKPGMDSKQVIARFGSERQALAMMDHPNIAKVFDAGTTETGRPYFVMELVKGIPITEYCDQATLTPRQRLELFIQVCQAVQHAHQKGIIHRDIKPTNVLVTLHDDKPVPKVIDFGIAKATGQQLTEHTLYTQFNQMIGTPLYMSPEQAALSALDVDTRSDIYSLGVLLYELLTGTTPFDKERLKQAAYDEMRRIVREEDPPKPSTRVSTLAQGALTDVAAHRQIDPRKLGQIMRGDLDWIVMRCLEKDRTRRYESASALGSDIERHLKDEPVEASPPSPLYRLRKLIRRHRVPLTAAAAVVLLFLVVLPLSTVAVLATASLGAVLFVYVRTRAAWKSAVAERNRAEEQRKRAEILLAHSLVEQANALEVAAGPSRSWPLYNQAWDALRQTGTAPLSAELGLLDSYDRNPPPLLELFGHSNGILFMDVSRDGRLVLTASKDGTLKLWELRTGRVIQTLVGHEHWVNGCALSPDAKLALSAGDDKEHRVRLWDLETGRQLRALDGHSDAARVVAFSPDGKFAVSGGQDNTLRLWEVTTGKPLWVKPHAAAVRAAAFAPDGASILVGLDQGTKSGMTLVEAATGGQLREFEIGSAQVIRLHPDGQHAFSANFKRETVVWNLRTGEARKLREGNADLALAVSPDGQRLLGGSDEGTVAIWDIASGERTGSLFGMTEGVRGVAWSPDGRILMAAGLDKTLRVWALEPLPGSSRIVGSDAEAGELAFSSDGRMAMTLTASALWLRDTATAMPLAKVPLPPNDGQSRIFGGRVAAREAGGAMCVLELPSGRELFRLPGVHHSWPGDCAFAPERSLLAVQDYSDFKNPLINVWNLRSRSLIRTFTGHQSFISSIQITRDGALVASGSMDGTVRLWETASGKQLRRADFPNGVRTVTLSPDEHSLLVGDQVGWIYLLELPSLREIRRFAGHTTGVSRLSFSFDSQLAASAETEELSVQIWDLGSGRSLHAFAGRGFPTFAPDGRALLVSNARQPSWTLEVLDFNFPARQREFQQNLRAAHAALQSNPNDPAALRTLGEYFAFRRVNDWAVDLLERARAGGANVSSLLLARCYWQLDRREDAAREFRSAMKRNEAPSEYLTLCLNAVTAPPTTAASVDAAASHPAGAHP